MSNNNQYCPTNILVTGGAGFIGSNFVHYWLKEYPTKSNSELGYKPDESFVTGIDKTITWYLDNEDWWRHIMSGEYQDWINQQYEK